MNSWLSLDGFGTKPALIGVLPTYAAIGVAAPLLLTLLRLIQGAAIGGEWGGSVLIAMEWGPSHRRGFTASWPQSMASPSRCNAAHVTR